MRAVLAAALLAALTACAPTTAPSGPSVSDTPPASPTATSAPASTTVAPPVIITPTVTSPPSVTVTPTITAQPTTVPAPAPVTSSVEITWYGAFDDDPPGSVAIDRPDSCKACIHKTAGGTGTWADPLTFASPISADGKSAYAYGDRIYVGTIGGITVNKYFIREDSCAVSWTAPNGCGAATHVDLYMGNPSGTKDVLTCEDALTPDGLAPIVVNPAPDLPVDPAPLWMEKTKSCHVR